MKAIGLVFLYNRSEGNPEAISKKFSKHFPMVTENLVTHGLINLPELKEIMDINQIYWAGIKERFLEILENEDAIGKLAWKVFKDFSGKEPFDEVKSLIYDGDTVPWNFTLMACVLYES
ncbi:MAG: hypothetical protein ACFFA6_06850 [Promethearchaeota archaeon]